MWATKYLIMQELTTEVLIVGGGVGGTTAAIQAARRGAKTILVSEWSWLGGMLTTAGVSAPDGNELIPWQTGIWGEFLQALHSREKGGLNHGWVSFFTFQPATAANILAEWVNSLTNLHWIPGQIPLAVLKQGNSIIGVQFADLIVKAEIIIDGTELGDLLELGEIPYRWGWELQSVWGEPSAPIEENELTKNYPVQAPTWVVIMQDFMKDTAPPIAKPANYQPTKFTDAWLNHGPQQFLNYGGLPGNQMM
ncbi:MAG: FAD-dependent oxidoreductase, partial [Microcoleaceae cyanobacterium]